MLAYSDLRIRRLFDSVFLTPKVLHAFPENVERVLTRQHICALTGPSIVWLGAAQPFHSAALLFEGVT